MKRFFAAAIATVIAAFVLLIMAIPSIKELISLFKDEEPEPFREPRVHYYTRDYSNRDFGEDEKIVTVDTNPNPRYSLYEARVIGHPQTIYIVRKDFNRRRV